MKKLLTLAVLSLAAMVAMPAAAADNKGSSKMAECNAKTKGMSKDDAAKARSECMKAAPAKPAKATSKMAECNAKTKGMSKADASKARSECMKAS
jgi:hypothetical protein